MKTVYRLLAILILSQTSCEFAGSEEELLYIELARESESNATMSFSDMIIANGKYKVVDHKNRSLYFEDGEPSCPNESQLNEYDQINPPPITNRNIYQGRNGSLYYEKEGQINYMTSSDVLIDHDKFCVVYSEIEEVECSNGFFKFCIVTIEDCYENGVLLSSTEISRGPCTPCDLTKIDQDGFAPWSIMHQLGVTFK